MRLLLLIIMTATASVAMCPSRDLIVPAADPPGMTIQVWEYPDPLLQP